MTGREKLQRTWTYSWLVTETEAIPWTKAEIAIMREMVLNPPPAPWSLSIAESGQKHILFRTPVNQSTENKSAPLAYLTANDVFALLHKHQLPVHPAYAMLGGGRWQRPHLRVASLGGKRGDGIGRAEWEMSYYGDVLRRIQAARQQT